MIRRFPLLSELIFCGLFATLAATPTAGADFSLFGDLKYVDSDAPDSPASFALGMLDFYVTQEINDRMTGFVELTIAADDRGEIDADLERLWIRYEVSSAFQIAGGRFHTPLGYWNRTYHHGALIQDTVGRPFFLEFEDHGGFLPMHIVGLMATGERWTGSATLRYELAVGNGQQLDSSAGLDPDPGDRPEAVTNSLGDRNSDKSFSGRLSLVSDRGWQVGVFGLTQEIAESGSPELGALLASGETLIDQTLLGFDVRYEGERFGVLGEYLDLANDAGFDDTGSYGSAGGYLQAWFDFNDKWRLTYRFSSLDTDEPDPFYRLLAVEEQDHNLLTLSYRTDEVSVIKVEVDRLESPAPELDGTTTLRAQWAFLIP